MLLYIVSGSVMASVTVSSFICLNIFRPSEYLLTWNGSSSQNIFFRVWDRIYFRYFFQSLYLLLQWLVQDRIVTRYVQTFVRSLHWTISVETSLLCSLEPYHRSLISGIMQRDQVHVPCFQRSPAPTNQNHLLPLLTHQQNLLFPAGGMYLIAVPIEQ